MQWLARRFARAIGIPEKRSDAAPKRFACRIGFFFALGTVALLPFAPAAAALVAAALLFFNVLDGVFDFCVGCWMYTAFLLPRSTDS
jgi:predicted membrane channel-forming protein YqfA (hemolysin III family)